MINFSPNSLSKNELPIIYNFSNKSNFFSLEDGLITGRADESPQLAAPDITSLTMFSFISGYSMNSRKLISYHLRKFDQKPRPVADLEEG